MTVPENNEALEQVRERLLELLPAQKHRLASGKRSEIAVEIVKPIAAEGQFPDGDYAFDPGVLSRPSTEVIESCEQHGVTEIERLRHILWHHQWQRVDAVAQALRTHHPESFHHKLVGC